MKQIFVPICGGITEKPTAYIGPSQNLKTEVRKFLPPMKKQMLLERQRSRCNSCTNAIQLYPFASCDADHIIGVDRGGQTKLENMQLLCVQCHRAKSAREARAGVKIVDICLESGASDVYIFTPGKIQLQFPVDKRTPLEAIEQGCGLSLITFKRVNRISVLQEAQHENDLGEMFRKFIYTPTRHCRHKQQ